MAKILFVNPIVLEEDDGAGVVVINDVPDYATVVGVPAKPI